MSPDGSPQEIITRTQVLARFRGFRLRANVERRPQPSG
jgi:hypothetical protein